MQYRVSFLDWDSVPKHLMFEVLFGFNPDYGKKISTLIQDGTIRYDVVGTVEAESLADVYSRTTTGIVEWSVLGLRHGWFVRDPQDAEKHHRSIAPGDLITTETGATFVVSFGGFQDVFI